MKFFKIESVFAISVTSISTFVTLHPGLIYISRLFSRWNALRLRVGRTPKFAMVKIGVTVVIHMETCMDQTSAACHA